MKKISICIPNYNNAPFLEECLRSAVAVEWPNKEILFVDDASTDGSMEIAQRFDGIRIFSNEKNMGQPLSTNRCLEEATGDYVVILHSDDYLFPNFAKTLAPHLDQHPEVGMLVGERIVVDEDGTFEEWPPFYNQDCIIPGLEQARIFMLSSFLPCQVLVRRSVLHKVGLVDPRHVVNLDGLLWFKCALAKDVGYVQEKVCAYRVHPNSTTSQLNRSGQFVMEIYNTIMAIVHYGRDYELIRNNTNKALKRIGTLAVRHSLQSLEEGLYDETTQFLDFARAFDQDIVNNYDYKVMRFCLEAGDVSPQILFKLLRGTFGKIRNISYAPSPGWRPLGGIQ